LEEAEATIYNRNTIGTPNSEYIPIVTNTKTPVETGFSKTLHPLSNHTIHKPSVDKIVCPQIYETGKNVNKKYYLPSQFPNITKRNIIKTNTTNRMKPMIKGKKREKKGGSKKRKTIKRNKGKRSQKTR
jgi:hypothetical protein